MNKLLIFAFSLLLLLTGCTRNTANKGMTPSSIPSANSVYPQTPPVQPAVPETPRTVTPVNVNAADTAMYRGIIKEMTDNNGKLSLILEQAAGTNFGAAALNVIINEKTKMVSDKSEIQIGSYIEVIFNNQDMDQTVSAISLKKLPDANLSVFNGTLEKHNPDKKENDKGSITLKSLDEKKKIVFNYGPETAIFLDVNELEKGAKLNIYFSGAATEGKTAKAYALEIRHFSEQFE